MLGCQIYKLDWSITQVAAELLQECGCLAEAFVNDDPFDEFHDLIAFLPAALFFSIRPITRSGEVGNHLPSSACVVQQDRSGVLAQISVRPNRRKLNVGLSAVASSTHAVLIEKYVLDAINGNKKSVSERKD
jgi:hypothetical protein